MVSLGTFWQIFSPRFGILHQDKSGNPDENVVQPFSADSIGNVRPEPLCFFYIHGKMTFLGDAIVTKIAEGIRLSVFVAREGKKVIYLSTD
jgi:hypothetical protein